MLGDAVVARDVGRLEIASRADADRVHRAQVGSAVGATERVDQFFGDVRIAHPVPSEPNGPASCSWTLRPSVSSSISKFK